MTVGVEGAGARPGGSPGLSRGRSASAGRGLPRRADPGPVGILARVTTVEAYLSELDATLRGPRRVKADLLAEARDSLDDAAEAYRRAGADACVARAKAVADFGGVAEVAPGYQAVLSVAQGRRTALLVFGVLAMQPFVWGPAGPSFASGQSSPGGVFELVDTVIETLGAVGMGLSLLGVLACGTGVRYLGLRPLLARATGLFAYAVAGAFLALGLLLAVLGPHTEALAGALWFTAVLIVPLGIVARSARRCLAVA
jgi:hypothetical protein